jgi:hypothetical protein
MRLFIAFFFVFISMPGVATTLFVSDIDDTIKISHILNTTDAASNVARINNHFYGMAQLYRTYNKAAPATPLIYLSAAPRKAMYYFHFGFLSYNRFPSGTLILRETLNDSNFKIQSLRSLIERYQPDKMVLVGDNGEKDIAVYAQIQAENPHIEILTYIHLIYSYRSKTDTGAIARDGQRTFVTAIDLAERFLDDGLISVAAFDKLILEIGPKITSQSLNEDKGSVAFPSWMDCRDYLDRSLPLSQISPSFNFWPRRQTKTTAQLLQSYKELVQRRCAL